VADARDASGLTVAISSQFAECLRLLAARAAAVCLVDLADRSTIATVRAIARR
jgi:hypothetical protein